MITMMMIIIIIIVIINNDDNNWNTNADDRDQTITIFQTMHFRENVISAKPKFLVLTHVLMYGYWCCQFAILSAYDASKMFLLHYYQSITML